MTEETPDKEIKTPIYQCVFRGETSEGKPIQRVYVTENEEQAAAFNSFIRVVQHELHTPESLDETIAENFPDLELRLKEVGEDNITSIENLLLPDTLPLDEGFWDKKDDVQLLKRALIEYYGSWHDGARRRNNELVSNLPTFFGAAVKADNSLLIGASIGGALVAAAIQWRSQREKNKLIDTLKIWIKFQNDLQHDPLNALDTLNKNMRDGGLLFSGIPEHNLNNFPEKKLIQAAKKFKVWYDKDFIEQKRNIRLPKAEDFHGASRWISCVGIPKVLNNTCDLMSGRLNLFDKQHFPKWNIKLPTTEDFHDASRWISCVATPTVLNGTCEFVSEQLSDLYKNPRWSTFKTIGKGLKDTGPLLCKDIAGHFIQAARHKHSERKHLDPEHGTPITNDREDLQQIRIEHCDVIMSAADPVYAERLFKVLKQAKSERFDGAVMGTANIGETVFMGMHGMEIFHAAQDLIEGSTEAPETWMDNPFTTITLSVGSICLALGAHRHIGAEVSHIRATLESRAAETSEELRPQIISQYIQSKEKDTSPGAEL